MALFDCITGNSHSSPSHMSTRNIMSKFRVSRDVFQSGNAEANGPSNLAGYTSTSPNTLPFPEAWLGNLAKKMPNTPNLHTYVTVYCLYSLCQQYRDHAYLYICIALCTELHCPGPILAQGKDLSVPVSVKAKQERERRLVSLTCQRVAST